MNEQRDPSLSLLAGAILLGVAGDLLLRGGTPGLNGWLWVTGVLALLLWVARRRGDIDLRGRWWILLPAWLCAAGLVWRDSGFLKFLDIIGSMGSMALACAYLRTGDPRHSSLTDYVLHAITSGLRTALGLLPVLGDVHRSRSGRATGSGKAVAAVRGLVIAIPLLVLFGGLFMSADAVFQQLIANTVDIQIDQLLGHVVLAFILAWIAGGFVRASTMETGVRWGTMEPPTGLALGVVEVGVILGSLNLLFLTFVLVQFRWLFGGSTLVLADTGLTYADYARRGFFELLGVAALVLPTLLVGHWLSARENPQLERLFRWLSGSLIGLLAIIMASAFKRMWLYQAVFGLTELRVYATACMVWVGLLIAWFALTVLRGKADRFAFGAVVSGLAVLAGLHILNPDALIVRVNIGRQSSGFAVDGRYVTSLSTDASPALLEVLDSMPPADRPTLVLRLLKQLDRLEQDDWRSWNWSRSQARAALRSRADQLQGTPSR